jgi:hypothetical protein
LAHKGNINFTINTKNFKIKINNNINFTLQINNNATATATDRSVRPTHASPLG